MNFSIKNNSEQELSTANIDILALTTCETKQTIKTATISVSYS